jgi:hypothetical protein
VPTAECPGCGAANDAGADAFCPWCGLDLLGPEAIELRRLAGQLGELDRQLWDLDARRRRLAAELGRRQLAASRATVPPRASGSEPAWRGPRESTPWKSSEWSVDRVRSLLLWVGAALLAASALTFTAVAWAHLGDGGRALLLVGVTALSVGSALGLSRRLPATAEAFTALSIALALIDLLALRRAGMAAGMSATAWWAVGSLTVSIFAFALGIAVGKRTSRVAIALLVPLSLELTVATDAGAVWSFALGFALIAGVAALAWRLLQGRAEESPARVALMAHAIATWSAAAILVLIASAHTHTLVQSLVPAGVVLTLALAPLALLRRGMATEVFEALAVIVCAVIPGALVVGAAATLGPQGMLAWATVVGAAAIVIAPSLPRRWTRPACFAGGLFGAAGLAYSAIAAQAAIFGPLAWLRDAWQGSLASPARAVYAGRSTTTVWRFGWPAVVALGSCAIAIATVAVPSRRRHALVPVQSAPLALGGVATLAALAACLAPVVAGASAGVACATTAGVLSALLVGAAILDRFKPRLAGGVLPVAVLPGIAVTGWAALTSTSSVVVLGLVCVVALLATVVAASDWMRAALGAFSGATAISFAGVATVASGRSAGCAGFAAALAAGVILLAGVHGRWRVPEGVALEVVGVAGAVVGVSIAAQQPRWLAGTLTATVPILLIAALRRERTVAYSIAAGAVAVGATWAWLAVAHVTVVEAYTSPAAAIALGVGLFEWRRGPARSWLALGPAIVLGLGPTLVLGIARDDLDRTVVAAVMAFAIVGLGAWKQLQAPLALGSVALLTLAVDAFGPTVARLPRWLSLAVIGVLLMWIGATFETRRDRAKRATRTLLDFG